MAYKPTKGDFIAYEDEPANVAKYGYLYSFETAKRVCPDSWHLPSDAEWQTLELTIGLTQEQLELDNYRGEGFGTKLKQQKVGMIS